jgi:LysR family glycine cleavage system transcriptional activator
MSQQRRIDPQQILQGLIVNIGARHSKPHISSAAIIMALGLPRKRKFRKVCVSFTQSKRCFLSDYPSISGLRALEAAARHLSFQQAARELNVTPGAVSRQIQALEEYLDAQLFTRRHKHVELTALGRDYVAEVRGPLNRIGQATKRVRGGTGTRGTVSICVFPTFAIRWLVPRWGRFYNRHPEIDVRLTTSLNPVDFTRDEYDLAVRVGQVGDDWGRLRAHKLIEIENFPVCSPALATKIESYDDLAQQTLIHGAPRPEDWRRWLAEAGASNIDAEKGIRFESTNLALQAAIEGIGVAIAIDAFVIDDLAQGRLVRLFDVSRHSNRPFHLVYPEARANDPRLIAFRDWMLEEAAADQDAA